VRHRKNKKTLGRTKSHQKSMMRNLARSLVTYELIQTTDTKAKLLRSYADKLITLGKRGTVHARRQALSMLGGDRKLVAKVFDDLATRDAIADRNGGYTRIIKLANRKGDDALVSRISWVGSDIENTTDLRFPEHIAEQIEDVEVDYEVELEE
jgi:large subunit ribosomal protein L17